MDRDKLHNCSFSGDQPHMLLRLKKIPKGGFFGIVVLILMST